MVLGKLPLPGRPTIWTTVGQGPTALAVGAGEGCFDIFTLIYPFFSLSPSPWETARYRLKYYLKEPLNQKKKKKNQPTNQSRQITGILLPVILASTKSGKLCYQAKALIIIIVVVQLVKYFT